MKILPASFIVLSTVCVAVCGFNNRSPIGDCPGCRKIDVISFEPLKRVAMIKAEILRRLGISQQQSGNPPAPHSQQPTAFPKMRQKNADVETTGNVIKADDTQELSELLSYSEIPDNYTDANIIQFKVAGSQGQKLLVKSANLVVRVKYKQRPVKQQRSSSGEKHRRKRKRKLVDLMIYSVDIDGKPSVQLASIKSRLRKTKWLRLSLPKDMVQKAVDSDSKLLQVYLKCKGCDKRTRLILAQKGRRRRNLVTGLRRLHKRRPILYLHTQIQSDNRSRRSTSVQKCSPSVTGCSCRLEPHFIDINPGWSWLIAPTRFNRGRCATVCSDDIKHAQNNVTSSERDNTRTVGHKKRTRNLTSHNICAPVSSKSLAILYVDYQDEVRIAFLPDMIVTKCGCEVYSDKFH